MHDSVEATNHVVLPIKMSLSATFGGQDWKGGDMYILCVSLKQQTLLIMVEHVGEDKH